MAELLSVNATVIPEVDAVNDGAYPLFPRTPPSAEG